VGFDVLDFWRWSASDLVSNTTRGLLAEFIVARALGLTENRVRDGWAAFDLQTESGLRIEVKSAACVQTWNQKELSAIRFCVPETRAWDGETGLLSKESRRQADVYVFALLHHRDKRTIDPLNLEQWRFYVIPTTALPACSTLSLNVVEKLADGGSTFAELSSAVERVAQAIKR
jgi:hypothetical protein